MSHDDLIEKEAAFVDQVAALTPERYAQLKQALELGRWPNGERLSTQQRSICMEAVILYDHQKLPEEARTLYIEKRGCQGRNAPSADVSEEAVPVRVRTP